MPHPGVNRLMPHPVQWVPASFPGGKAAGAWR